MDLYEKIKLLASEKKMSIRQLEEALGFGNGVINRWRKNTPGSDKLKKVADYFDVSTDYLLGRTDSLSFTLEDSEIKKMDDKKKEDIRIIQRAAIEMSDDEREVAIDLWKAAFKKAFDESTDNNDN